MACIPDQSRSTPEECAAAAAHSSSLRPVKVSKAKLTVLDQTVSAGQQSVTATRVLDVGGKMLRFRVKSDSYDFQSYARAELWSRSDGKWNEVHSIPYGLMKTPHQLFYLPNRSGVAIGRFEADLEQLQKVALNIVF